ITVVAPSNMMGSTVLIYNTMKYAGQTASPAVFGVILAAINFSGVFLVSSILGLCVVISALYMRKDLAGLDGNSTKNM
ncbi:MFS transporter, partial [Methanosalsum natronophilum]